MVNNVLRINNVFVLGAAPAFSLPRGGSAGLFLAINNEGAPDRLIGVTAPGTAAAVQLPAGGVRLPTQQSVLLSGPAPRVILRGLIRSRSTAASTSWWCCTSCGRATWPWLVPVMPRAQWFSTFSPAPLLVRPSPSPTGTASPSPSPSGTSPSPSPSATG